MVESGYCLLTCVSAVASCWYWRVAVGVVHGLASCSSGLCKQVSWDAATQTVCLQNKGWEIASPSVLPLPPPVTGTRTPAVVVGHKLFSLCGATSIKDAGFVVPSVPLLQRSSARKHQHVEHARNLSNAFGLFLSFDQGTE